ncbi:MAG: serine/threonine-protein phosphatase [Phycisphaerae bacterium]|nr:serine/threonine-protein phosphatase [Phycisphaerae bacterium]
MGPTPSAPIPSDLESLYEAERGRALRRRFLVYCFLVLCLVAVSVAGTLSDVYLPTPGEPPVPRESVVLDTSVDGALALLHLGAAAVVLFRPLSRKGLVALISWLIVLVAAVMIFTEGMSRQISIASGHGVFGGLADPAQVLRRNETAFREGLWVLTSVFVMHVLASLLIALSPAEGLRPLAPILALFAARTFFFTDADTKVRALLVGLSPLAGLPGFVWSLWRHRAFRQTFETRYKLSRYADISRELAEARRVHEALFPPPIARGAVRVNYEYEPRLDIGGDFLFVRPLAFPPSAPVGPVSVVLIDVTGHGVSAALAVNRLHDRLERMFSESPHIRPGEVLRRLNEFVLATLAPQAMFATAVCLRVEAGPREGAGAVEWASAGHPPSFLRREGNLIQMLESTAPMLGVVPDAEFPEEARRSPMGAGDVLIAYTDGGIEAEDSNHRRLTIEGLRNALLFHAPALAPTAAGAASAGGGALARALMRAVASHRHGPPADDTLIVQVDLAGS